MLNDVVHNQGIPVACTVKGCNYIGKTQLHLTRHMTRHSNERPFPCFVANCEYKAKSKHALWAHLKNFHCKECSSHALQDSKLQAGNCVSCYTCQHMQCADIKPFVCTFQVLSKFRYFPNCTYRSKSKLYLHIHEARHAKVKPHKCHFPQCSFRTALKIRWTEHIKSHDQRRPFPCTFEECNFRAKRKPNLKVHEENHKKDFRIPCPLVGCPYFARHRSTLKSHVGRHAIYPNFKVCPEPGCNYWTTSTNVFGKHEKIHSEGRLLACPLCTKNFTSKASLQQHSFSHTKEKPLQCEYCDYGCYYPICMARHYDRNHQDEVLGSHWPKSVAMCRHCSFLGNHDAILRHTATNHLILLIRLERIRIKTV